MFLRVQMNVNLGQIKNESQSEIFSALGDAQESANGTTINVFEVSLMTQYAVHLIIHMELHLKMHFKISINMKEEARLRLY